MHCVPDSVSDLRYLLSGHRDLGPLTEAETKDLVAAATKLGWSVDNGCAQEVYRLTAGHPLRLQYYLFTALDTHGKLTPQSVLAVHSQNTVAHLNGARTRCRRLCATVWRRSRSAACGR